MTARLAIVVVGVCALLTTSFASTTGTAQAQTAGGGQIEHADEPIPGQYIVRLRDTAASPSVASRADTLAAEYSGRVLATFDSVHGFVAHLSEAEALALSDDPAVEAVEEDGVVHASSTTQTPTPSWGLDRIDQAHLPLDSSYTYDSDGTGVTAFVIDTGIMPTHTDFDGRATIGVDFVGDGQNGVDCSGHGTHVAGTIGGTTYGIAKAVQIVAVRVLNCSGSGSISQVISGINWVTTHHTPGTPAVANMSLGSGFSSSINAAVESSIASGVTYVLAAGNGSQDACSTSPASAPHAITVGATSQNDARASFSNIGPCVDLFAPGVGITSDWINSTTSTRTLDGTSMASPHVAGVVARYLDAHPTATPATVAAAVTAAACHAVTNAGTGSNDLLLFAGLGIGQPTALPSSCGGEYTPITPTRILDTRGDPTLSCARPAAKVGAGQSISVPVIACAPLPLTGVAAVVMNVTVDGPTAPSYLTVSPLGSPQPNVSNLNFVAGQTVPNLVTVELGSNASVAVFNFSGAVDVIIDVVGWYGFPGGTPGSRFHPASPDRILDTRGDPSTTCNPGAGVLGPAVTLTVHVTACEAVKVPANATAVAVNVTVTQPTAPGFLNVFPGNLPSASTSSLNFVPALTVPNLVIVQLSPTGTIKLFNSAGFTQAIVDVVGWYDTDRTTEAGQFVALAPARVLDTRSTAPIGPAATNVFMVAGTGGVPVSGVGAVVMNVTVADPTADGFLSVFPTGGATPPSSNLNFVAGQTVPNLVMVGLGSGQVSAFNLRGFTQVIYDVAGWFTS